MRAEDLSHGALKIARSNSAANATATATAAAIAGARHLLKGVLVSIRGGTPTTQDVDVTDGGTTLFKIGIAAVAPTVPIWIPLPAGGVPCGIGSALAATVPAAGVGVIIEITLFYTPTAG